MKKGKSKVSHVKKSNQLQTKLSKQGKLKKRRNKRKLVKSTQAASLKALKLDYLKPKDEDDEIDTDPTDMFDAEELASIQNSFKDKPFLFTNTLEVPDPLIKNKKRKRVKIDDSRVEDVYEASNNSQPVKKQKLLLPIKTNQGLVKRFETLPESDLEDDSSPNKDVGKPNYEKIDSNLKLIAKKEEVTTADLIAVRERTLQKKKFRIGLLSSGLLESPEAKVGNFKALLELLDEKDPEVKLTVKKLTLISLLEVFKDLIPAYAIKHQNEPKVKLKKDVKQLYDYENSLLSAYKTFLQKIEKMLSILRKKKGDTRVFQEAEIKLAELALQCLCDILKTHPYFNFSKNIVYLIVPYLNCSSEIPRNIVYNTIKSIFKTDAKGELSLEIVRSINKLVKKKNYNVNPATLDVFLSLKLKDINLDEEKEEEIKKKKIISRKHNILRLSKRERKREKRLKEVNKELLETKGEENKKAKQHYLTEVTKIVFLIYFKILKLAPSSKLLKAALEGLAKFAHCINIDFYHDLINVLDFLIDKENLGPKEQLCCVQTIFTILSYQGASLNIDPIRFYTHLYNILFHFSAGKNHEDLKMILTACEMVVIKRRKQISLQRLLAFTKRFSTLSCHVLPNGTLGLLAILRQILQLSKAVGVLLDTESGFGQGIYQPELEEPEYCNASTTALWELTALQRHYHPTVKEFALYVSSLDDVKDDAKSSGKPFVKKSPEELFADFDASQVRFNPPVQPPVLPINGKVKYKNSYVSNSSLKEYVQKVLYNNKQC